MLVPIGSTPSSGVALAQEAATVTTAPSGEGEKDGSIDLYGPPPAYLEDDQLTVSEFSIDAFDGDVVDLLRPDNDGPNPPLAAFAAKQESVSPFDRELGVHVQEVGNNPRQLLDFVAKNTNPQRHWFGFRNLLDIIKDIITLRKPMMVLNRNCVHCARAVDNTLAQLDGKNKTPRLCQVNDGGVGQFAALMSDVKGEVPRLEMSEQGGVQAFIGKVKAQVLIGQRGIFSVQVRGYPFSHAMNVVHTSGGRLFLLCGQQGKVYDMTEESECEHFWQRYGGGTSIVFRTGDAPKSWLPAPSREALREISRN